MSQPEPPAYRPAHAHDAAPTEPIPPISRPEATEPEPKPRAETAEAAEARPRRRLPLPVPPPLNLGRRLRALAGVDEKLMAHEMDERAAIFRKRRAEIDLEVLEHKAELHDRLTAATNLLDGAASARSY